MSARPAARWALPASVAALLALVIASLGSGDLWLGPERLWEGLWRRDELAATVLWNIRLPRLVVGMLVGAGLSASGVIMQAFFRNSLASPGLLGVSAGGAAGAVTAIAAGWASLSLFLVPLSAISGAFIATGAVVIMARGGASTERLLLAGIALNALLGAITSYTLTSSVLTYERNAQILFWLLGGLEDRGWDHVWMSLAVVPVAALAWPLGRPMDLLSLGAPEAQSLGVDVRRLRRAMLTLSTVLAALATAVAGTVGFVGLIVPHILRLLIGPEHRRLIPVALIGGAAFVVACDLAARTLGHGLRLGIVTSLVGGPFFLWLLRRQP